MLGVLTTLTSAPGCGGTAPREAEVAAALGPPASASTLPALAQASSTAADLPSGAAYFAAVDLDRLEQLATRLPVLAELGERALQELDIADVRGASAKLAERAGVDRTRPIMAAVGVVDVEAVISSFDTFRREIDAGSDLPRALSASRKATAMTYHRVVIPLQAGRSAGDLLNTLGALLALEEGLVRCPGKHELCNTFAPLSPVAVFHEEQLTAIALQSDGALILEIAVPVLGADGAASMVEPLRRATHLDRGGPPAGTCAEREPEDAVWLCIDPDRAADHGTAQGLSTVLWAIAGADVDPAMVLRILEQGRVEAERPREQAALSRRLLEGLTVTARAGDAGALATLRWSTTPAGRAVFERALPRPVERPDYRGWINDMVLPVARAVGDPGKELSDRRDVLQGIQEGGAASLVVAVARGWPNLAAVFADEIDPDDVPYLPPEAMPRSVRAAISGDVVTVDVAVRPDPQP